MLEKRKDVYKGDTTIWFHLFYTPNDIDIEELRSYYIENSPGRYDEALLKKTTLRMNGKNSVLKNFYLFQRLA